MFRGKEGLDKMREVRARAWLLAGWPDAPLLPKLHISESVSVVCFDGRICRDGSFDFDVGVEFFGRCFGEGKGFGMVWCNCL